MKRQHSLLNITLVVSMVLGLGCADEMDPAWLEGIGTIGLTAGASAPEKLVREVVDRLSDWRLVEEEVIAATEENMIFKLPRQLTD